jgi:hypothetical protein
MASIVVLSFHDNTTNWKKKKACINLSSRIARARVHLDGYGYPKALKRIGNVIAKSTGIV